MRLLARNSAARGPGRAEGGRRLPRPSLLLWRYRHIVVALCLGGAALLALSALRPPPDPGQEVMVVLRPVAAGQVLTEQDLALRAVPGGAAPASGRAGAEAIGLRAAIALEPGTVLTSSMTSAALTRDLGPDERVVQVPVEVGAELAHPGALVDLVGPAPPTARAPAGSGADITAGESGAPSDSSGEVQAPPGGATAPFLHGYDSSAVLSSGARVVAVQSVNEGDQWTSGRKVTLVTLAVPVSDATLVVGAATNGALGIVLSP